MGLSSLSVSEMGFRGAVLKGGWRLTRRACGSTLQGSCAVGGTAALGAAGQGQHVASGGKKQNMSPSATGKNGENWHETS
jgi:hypothetical protein